MLVLSRRTEEKIILPTIPVVIKVIATQSGVVRLGIEAPAHVPILREELCQGERARPVALAEGGEEAASARQALRHRVNNLILGLALLRLQLQDEAGPVVSKTLAGLEDELEAMRRCVGPEGSARPEPQLAQVSA
jgi:carbon storage regulator CsrA